MVRVHDQRTAVQGCTEEELLQAWFPSTSATPRLRQFNESDVRQISAILKRASLEAWSQIPRIYVLLRLVDQLHAISSFQALEITDFWFPFTQCRLPEGFEDQAARVRFLELQHLVYDEKALDLERENTGHATSRSPADIPLKKIGELGRGAFGYVDRVISTITYREYARKQIPRGRIFRQDRQVLRSFEKELTHIKRLSQAHKHMMQLIGSYTERKHVGTLMSLSLIHI